MVKMMTSAQEAATQAAMKVTSAATYTGSGAAVFFGLTANEIAAMGGLLVAMLAAIGNFGLTWWYKHKHFQLARVKRASDFVEDDEE